MKKEVLIAIIIGFALGLVITFGVYNAKRSIQNRDQLNNPSAEGDMADEPTNESSHFINLTTPENYTIHDEDEISLTGITSPNSMLAVLNDEYETLASADYQGNFSIDVELDAGENIITLTAYNSGGEKAEEQISVIYSTADLEITEAPTDEEGETDEE